MIFEPSFIGRSGFYWFIGVVESRLDPLKSNRVQVRVKGYHNADKVNLPTDTLIWSTVMMPTTSASTSGIGENSKLIEGSWVFGFFFDAVESQESVIIGSWAGIQTTAANPNTGYNDPRTSFSGTPQKITATYKFDGTGSTFTNSAVGPFPRADRLDEPDTSRLARNDKGLIPLQITNKINSLTLNVSTALSSSTWSQPYPPWATIYPYNGVKESESGHVFEFDDTPGSERVHTYHRTGTFMEFNPDGSSVYQTVQDHYVVTLRNSYESVCGSKNLTVNKSYGIKAGNMTIDTPLVNITNSLTVGDGATGTFTSITGQVITVNAGIVTSIE